MEEGTSNGSSPWMPNSRDDKKKLRSLKRKYRSLEEENATLSEEVVRSRRLIARLQNERGFILNRLLKLDRLYRTSDTDTDSGGSSSESELEQSDAAPVKRKENGISPTAKRQKTVAGPPSIINVDPESLGLCTAVVRGRPCKSKSLSGYKFCWHHAPLDPNSPFTWCQFQGTLQKSKKCSIPVLKTKVPLLCKYHSQEEGAPGTATASPAGETKEKEKEKEQEAAQDKGLEELKTKRKDKKEKKKDKKEKKKKRRRERRAKKEEDSKQKGGSSGLQLKAIGGLNGTPMVDDNSIHLIDEDISVGSGDESPRGQLVISEDSEDSEDEGRGMSIADMEEDVQDV